MCYVPDHGVIPFLIPKDVSGDVTLQVALDSDPEVSTTSLITVVGPVRDIIVRPISKFYKPGETGMFTPVHSPYTARRS